MIGCGKSLTCKPCHTLLFYNKLRLCPMKRILFLIISLVSLFHTSASAQHVRPVFGFPASEPGYSLGVSACYAAQIGDWIVVRMQFSHAWQEDILRRNICGTR